MDRPRLVTLCGSMRFAAELAEVRRRLTDKGYVVLAPEDVSDLTGPTEQLGELHLAKVRVADEVYVVDPDGYVGESTRREIALAESLGTPVHYLSRETDEETG